MRKYWKYLKPYWLFALLAPLFMALELAMDLWQLLLFIGGIIKTITMNAKLSLILLADPPLILVLDEATSNVDIRTEFHIQEGMRCLMKGRTSFVIAHRLSTIKEADLILVIDQGRVIEQGNHQSLLDKKGFYWQLLLHPETLSENVNGRMV